MTTLKSVRRCRDAVIPAGQQTVSKPVGQTGTPQVVKRGVDNKKRAGKHVHAPDYTVSASNTIIEVDLCGSF